MTTTDHPLTPEDAITMTALRAALAAHPMTMSRASYDQLLEQIPDADGVRYEPGMVGGVPGVWCRPAAPRAATTMLYFHGGVYVFGSAHAHRHFAGQLAARAQIATFVVDYRLAPEHPFPAAIDDARAVAAAVAGELAVVGDSAGGGLALALLADRARRPVRGVLLSPWIDLALTGDSMTTRAAEDPLLSHAALGHGVTAYLNGRDARDPRASPLYAELDELPPTQVHVGTAEVLLDDARRLAARTPVELHVWHGLPHTFLRNVRTMAGARAALDLAGTFLAGAR